MTRALSTACVVLVMCCFAGRVRADEPKPKIAVLGLEAAPNREGIVDPQTTDVARQVTKELRASARGGAGGVVVAPNSDRELVDEKALANCDTEAAGCMAAIGAGLQTNYLLYGRVEKKGEGYRVSLRLLDVKLKTVEPASGELEGRDIAALARRLYAKLIGKDSAILIVNANAKAGKVMVDDDYKGKLVKGTVKIAGLTDGRHTLAIESVGFERYEASIIIERNETLNHTATMVEKDVVSDDGDDPKGTWRNLFYTSAALFALSGGAQLALFIDGHLLDIQTQNRPMFIAAGRNNVTEADCDGFDARPDNEIFTNPEAMPLSPRNRASLNRACFDNSLVNIGWITTPVFLLASSFFLYEWKWSGTEHGTQTAKHAHKSIDYAIAPVVTAQTTAMWLQITW